MATVGELVVKVGADITKFTRGLNDTTKHLNKMTKDAEKTFGPVMNKIGAAVKFVGAAAVSGFTAATAAGVNLNAELEQSRIAFTTMLGSAEKADAFLREMRDFAARTPFEFMDLQDAAKRMLAFGFAAEQVKPMLTAVGDAAAGLDVEQEVLNRITLALGQMQAKAKVSAQEMMQLTETGIPAWQMLADKMGLTTSEVMKLSEKGLIPADKAIQALVEGMENKFGGMMEKQSRTLKGMFSTMKDIAAEILTNISGPVFENLKGKFEEIMRKLEEWRANGALQEWSNKATAAINSFWNIASKVFNSLIGVGKWIIDNWGLIGPILAGVLAGFMAYKGAITVMKGLIAVIKGLKLAQTALNLVMAMNPIALITLAVAGLVAAGVALYQNWGKISTFFKNIWQDMKIFFLKTIDSMLAKIQEFTAWIPIVGDAVKNLRDRVNRELVESFQEQGKALANSIKPMDDYVSRMIYAKNNVDDLTTRQLKATETQQKLTNTINNSVNALNTSTDVTQTATKYYKMAQDEIDNLEASLNFLERRIKAQDRVVDDWGKKLDAAKAQLETAANAVKEMEQAIADTEAAIKGFGQAPLAEAKEISDAMWQVEQQSAAIEKALLEIKMGKRPAEEAEKLEKQLDNLRNEAEMLRLREKLEIDPLRRELEQLTDTTKYLTFAEARQGALDAQQKLASLQQQMKSLIKTQKEQQSVVQTLQAEYDREKAVLDSLTEAHETAKDAVDELKDSIADMVKMSIEQYNKFIEKAKEVKDAMQSAVKGGTSAGKSGGGTSSAFDEWSKGMSDAQKKVALEKLSSSAKHALGVPGYATGTDYVPETGIYRLHKGEKVIPAGRNGGGDIYIENINLPNVTNGYTFVSELKDVIRLRTGRTA